MTFFHIKRILMNQFLDNKQLRKWLIFNVLYLYLMTFILVYLEIRRG